MFNVAIIGISGFGNVHYEDLIRERANGRINIVAATVINQDEEREKCAFLGSIGCRLYTDYRKMLSDNAGKIDICFIPTGIAMHMPMTIEALEKGANVFVEKPIAPTVADAEKMLTVSKNTGKFIAVGYQAMYQPETWWIKKQALSGRIGKVRVLKAHGYWPRNDIYYHRNNWAGKLLVDGIPVLDSPVTNCFSHFLNLLLFYAGEGFESTATIRSIQCGMYRANPIESCDTADLKAMAQDGKTVLFYTTHCSEQHLLPYFELVGDLGRIEYDTEKLCMVLKSGEREEFPVTAPQQIRPNIFIQLEKRLSDPKALVCTPEIAMNHTLICNAMFDATPIINVPKDSFRVEPDDKGSLRRVIPGIDDAMRRAFAENRLLGTVDFQWMKPAPEFSLEGYRSFRGTLIN